MEYKVNKLAEEYIKNISYNEFNIQTCNVPTFNIDAYNDYEYLRCIKEINLYLNQFDDLHITEKFLKGE